MGFLSGIGRKSRSNKASTKSKKQSGKQASSNASNRSRNGSSPKNNGSSSGQKRVDPKFPDRQPGYVKVGDIERIYDSPVKNKIATALAFTFAIVTTFLILIIAVRLLVGFFGAPDPVAEEQNRVAREEDRPSVESLAESFSASYLDVKVNDPEGAGAARVRPFVSTGRDPGEIGMARTDDEPLERRVISSSAYSAQKVRGGTWSVYTDNLVETRTRPNPSSESTSQAGQPGNGDDEEVDTAVVELEAGKQIERIGLEVFVALDADGRAAVVAPPTLIAPRSSAVEDNGVLINNSSPAQNPDPAIAKLVEGYLAAAYGDTAALETLDKFLVPGSTPPPVPPKRLEFDQIQNVQLFEAAVPADAPDNWTAVVDVEAYATVSDPDIGLIANQTEVLRVVNVEGSGWLIAGAVDAVSKGSGLDVQGG